MDKTERTVFYGLLAFGLVLVIFLACAHKKMWQPLPEPFIKDRVVTVRIVIPQKNWQQMLANPFAKEYIRAEFWFDGQRYPNVAVRAKGTSSLMSVAGSGSQRLSLKVDFNFFNAAQTFRGLSKLVLNNGFSDPTFIRETLGYEIFEQMGFPTPRTAFVDLWVNDVHLGLYTQVEQIDKAFLARQFSNPNGNLYKPEIGASQLNWTKVDLEKQEQNASQSFQQRQKDNLAINIGGSRLRDLLNLMERESRQVGIGNSNQTGGNTNNFAGPFPGGPGGGFPGAPGVGFPEGPGGPGERFPGGPGEGFPGGRGGPGGDFPGGFGESPRQLPQDANGLAAGANRPFEPGDPFQGRFGGPDDRSPRDPNGSFARQGQPPVGRAGMGGRGREFPGGGGPFGRGGNLLETMGLKTNENYQDHTALFRFLDVLNNCPNESFPTEIEKVLDVDQVLRYLAVSVMTVHLDNYIGLCHNFYLYEADGKFTILPWDLNMAFGGFNMGTSQGSAAEYYIDEPATMTDRPLVGRLLAYKPYLDRYHQYLEQMLSGCFAKGVIEARIDELAAMIRPYVKADDLKFSSVDDFEKGLNEGTSGGRGPFGMGTPPNMESAGRDSLEGRSGQNANEQGRSQGLGQRGPGGRGGPGGPGMGGPGLKSFISKRRVSVRKQLDGELPSKPDAQQL
jgi:spore coat protein CotH